MKKIILFIGVIFIFYSCDLLDTREPEPPNTQRSSFIPATTPDILFANMSNAFKEKILENYMACFVDTSFLNRKFSFIPSAGSASQFAILNDWRIEYEEQYFNHLINKTGDPNIILVLTEKEKVIVGDSASYQFDYSITFNSDDKSIPGNYGGSLLFGIHVDSQQQWVITRWEDIKNERLPSWSELKGRMYL